MSALFLDNPVTASAVTPYSYVNPMFHFAPTGASFHKGLTTYIATAMFNLENAVQNGL